MNAGGDGSPSSSSMRRWIRYFGKTSWDNKNRHTNKIADADFLPISCIANESIDAEAFSNFPNQFSSCSLCL